jgi:hypothetical protein
LQILVLEELDARIAQAAQRGRMSKGAWIRRVIEKALHDDAAAPDALARLSALGAPTGNLDQVLAEIEAGRR